MLKEVNFEEIVDSENIVFIDVRSEREYGEDTVPNAINMPILTNEERENVGYIYKNIDKDKAKEIGLKYAQVKLVDFYKKAKALNNEGKKIALFCYRGGMRSNSIANILNIMGIDVLLVRGGYKEYRKYVISNLDKYIQKHKYIVLHGLTGVGKTKIIRELDRFGQGVIDLEGLAQNSGSVFGTIGYGNVKVTQKKFESKLLQQLKNIERPFIFVESESRRIGQVNLPEQLYRNMKEGYHVLIETPLDNRIKNIYDEYLDVKADDKDEKIIMAINKLRRRLGNDVVGVLVKELKDKNYIYVIEKLMKEYYDPLYNYSIKKIQNYDMIIKYDNIDEAIEKLIEYKNLLCNERGF